MQKVLVISHDPFSKTSSNGKTLEAIFADYKREDIAQLFFKYSNVDFDFCANYFRIADFDLLTRNYNQVLQNPVHQNQIQSAQKKQLTDKMKKIIKKPLFRDIYWKFLPWKSKKLRSWLVKIKPNYVFFVGSCYGFSHQVAMFVCEELKIPLVVYYTDDYLIYPVDRDFFDTIQKKRMLSFYKKTIHKASLHFAIGREMAQEYSSYFHESFFPIMNMCPTKSPLPENEHDRICISFFGGLHTGRLQNLIRIGKIINQIRLKERMELDFHVYTSMQFSENVLRIFHDTGIEYCGFVSEKEIESKYADSDILIHVESDDKYNRSLTRLSISTKIPEYLMTGKCVLAFGPIEVASMRLLRDNNIGYVISSDLEDQQVETLLMTFLKNARLRDEISKKGYAFAVDNFDPIKNRRRFNMLINKMLNNWYVNI